MYWIRASVKRSQILQSRVINVPQRLHETHKKIQPIIQDLTTFLRRKPTAAEVSKVTGMPEGQIERCTFAMEQQCYSLDAGISNRLKPGESSASQKKDTLYDLVHSKEDASELLQLERLFMKDDLIKSMRRYLPPHEVDLLLLRFGLMDEHTLPKGFSGPLTISEVSQLVGLKSDKVRRLINNSLSQLKALIAHEWCP